MVQKETLTWYFENYNKGAMMLMWTELNNLISSAFQGNQTFCALFVQISSFLKHSNCIS